MFKRIRDFITKISMIVSERLKKVSRDIQKNSMGVNVLKYILLPLLIIVILYFLMHFILWIVALLFREIGEFIDRNFVYILVVGLFIIWLKSYSEKTHKKEEDEKRKINEEQLQKQSKQANGYYNYLKNFLFRILYNQHFCDLVELIRPLTVNNLNENPPYEIDAKSRVVFYNFRVDKKSIEPLEKGTENIVNLLQSAINYKAETTGIEGVCPPVKDNLRTVLAVHSILDGGSYVKITLVFDNDEYRSETSQMQEYIQPPVIEEVYLK